MIGSPPEPAPVPVRKYRYSKWRWRILVRFIDLVGGLLMLLWRLFRPARKVPRPRRILLVQLDHLGDAVLTSPLFPLLRAAYPEAAIHVLASPSGRAVFEANPEIEHVWLAERNWFERKPGRWACLSAVWKLGCSLRRQRYDLGIDVRGDVLSVAVLALAGIPRRLGWAMGGGGFLLTDIAPWNPARHEVESRLALLEAIGIRADEPARVDVHVADSDRTRVARGLHSAWLESQQTAAPAIARPLARVGAPRASFRDHHPRPPAPSPRWEENDHEPEPDSLHAGRFASEIPLLAVHLGAGTLAKRWPIRHWQRLIDRFLADGWRIVIVGGADDVELSRTILPHPGLCDWTGRLSIGETTALLERAELFLGVDSGPAHLAAAAGTTSVILFSGTNRIRQWRPWSRRSLVLRKTVPCRPCHRKVCPLADHPCLSLLRPDKVYAAANRWYLRINGWESPHARF